MNITRFISKARSIHDDNYNYTRSIYINYKTKLEIICPTHGPFWQSPQVHLHMKHGCPKCAHIRMDTKSFINRSIEIHGSKYDYSKTVYKNTNTKVIIICPRHGEFEVIARRHFELKYGGCKRCAKNRPPPNKLTHKEFISRSISIHDGKYDYSKAKYAGTQKKVIIICPIHGEFLQKAALHLRGHQCPKCATQSATGDIDSFKEKAALVHNNKYNYSISNYINARSNINIICPRHGRFAQLVSNHLAGSGCPKCPAVISSMHAEVQKFINLKDAIINDRNIIAPYELDIYIPELRLGIEVHGDYWHSWHPDNDRPEDKHKHYTKFLICKENNIKLLQIYEHEWVNPTTQDIWKSILNHSLNAGIRKYHVCQCKVVKNPECKDFLNTNHLRGYRGATVSFGLTHNKMLISVMTFSKHPGYHWEIGRYCTLSGHVITGGASELLREFIKLYDPQMILAFADLRYSTGGIYKKMGFKQVSITDPECMYINHGTILHNRKYRKHQLRKILDRYDADLSRSANMFANGFRRMYDAGRIKFVRYS